MEDSEIATALQKLTTGLGVFRPDLVEALNGELHELKRIWAIVLPKENDQAIRTARRAISGNLELLINQLEPRPAHQGLLPEQRAEQYRTAIKVFFNLPFSDRNPEYLVLRTMDLTRRRNWLANDAPGYHLKVSPGQDDLADAISKIAELLSNVNYVPAILESPAPSHSNIAGVLPHVERERLIARQDYYHKLWEMISTSLPVMCIWGEPGTGKTTLAQDFFDQLFSKQLAGLPLATVRAGDPEQLRSDITRVLMFEGLEPTDWSDSYARAVFCQMYSRDSAELPKVRGIIMDNLSDEELIDQLIPESPRIPFLITTRKQPRNPRVSSVRLHGFTEDQSIDFIRKALSDADASDAHALSALFGGRPLALDHAVRFVHESPDVTIRDVIETVSEAIGSGLDLITEPEREDRKLTALYRVVLASLIRDANINTFLDSFLAIAGTTGSLEREFFFEFLHGSYSGVWNRVRFRSVLRTLEPHGLVRDVSDASGKQAAGALVMHQLTYEILRELRGATALLPIEGQLYAYLASFEESDEGFEDSPNNDASVGRIAAWWRAQSMKISRTIDLPAAWDSLLCIDESTWAAVLKQQNPEHQQAEVVRYEIRPHGLYKVSYLTTVREELTMDEAVQLYNAIRAYNLAMDEYYNLHRHPDSEPVPIDDSMPELHLPQSEE